MPAVTPGGTSPIFWSTDDILIFARVLINDAQGSTSGQDLAIDRPYTWPLLQLCYEKLGNWLEDSNVESATYNEETIHIPRSSPYSDPAALSRLGYDGFDDAAGFHYPLPTLPPFLLEPLELYQRPTGQNVPFLPMKQKLGGLIEDSFNGCYGVNGGIYGGLYGTWEFRQNSIYFLGGCYQPTDIRMRYIPGLPELIQPAPGQPSPTIWFARAGVAFAYLIAAEYAEIRNAANAANLRAKANEQLQIIANKTAKRVNQTQTRRRGYGFQRQRRAWL